MNRITFIILYVIGVGMVVSFFFFRINPIKHDSLYFIFLCVFMFLVIGLRRKKLGMTFAIKYSLYSKEFYKEFARMFTEK